jgi:hypothetical protein
VTTTSGGVTEALAGDMEYLPFGPMASLAYGNGIPLVRTFDRDYRLTTQTAGTVQALAFRLDPNGNLTGITNPLDPNRIRASATTPSTVLPRRMAATVSSTTAMMRRATA